MPKIFNTPILVLFSLALLHIWVTKVDLWAKGYLLDKVMYYWEH